MRTLDKDIAFLMKSIKLGKEKYYLPEKKRNHLLILLDKNEKRKATRIIIEKELVFND